MDGTRHARVDETTVAVVGGGPAGLMLGALLARQGVRVDVFEKHDDFLRDFRGDTVHPSTLEVMRELGWLDGVLELPHTVMRGARVRAGGRTRTLADFTRLPVACPYVAFMPQWDFLDFVAARAEAMPAFRLHRSTAVTGLRRDGDGAVTGVTVSGPDGVRDVRAALVVGCDGRDSRVRDLAGLRVAASPAQLEVLWFRIDRRASDPRALLRIGPGVLITIDRGDYWQVAVVVPAGTIDAHGAPGLADIARRGLRGSPEFRERGAGLREEDVHVLRVRVDRLRRWHAPGVLCIGDAAHAMSPAGGVGINLAIQDAVATARLLGPALAAGEPVGPLLDRVRRRRELPVRVVQFVQRRIGAAIGREIPVGHVPMLMRVVSALPFMRHAAGRLLGLGLRREHVDGPAAVRGRRRERTRARTS